ncbi:SufE family protein [Fodinicurvata sp. EGI_FJ10296]|uniref:SufE family protein n=1 Tax=Fodinicurvata sp. EGI_FJ10296 TaxID=3231908 RepID=UPI003451C482
MTTTIEELIDGFEMLDDWEERYAYIIDLGRRYTGLPPEAMVEDNKVAGCMSQVWLVASVEDGSPPRLHFKGDSDAAIVRGLIAILMTIYSDRTPDEIIETDIDDIFTRLGLDEHLSSGRRNGFQAMVGRIRSIAQAAAA